MKRTDFLCSRKLFCSHAERSDCTCQVNLMCRVHDCKFQYLVFAIFRTDKKEIEDITG